MQPFSLDSRRWNELISCLPDPHLLQTWEWAQVKAKFGWQPIPFVWYETDYESSKPSPERRPLAAAMILKRRIPVRGMAARLSVLYSPKGPLMDWADERLRERVLDDLQAFARRQAAIFLKIDPDVVLARGVPASETDAVENGGQVVRSALERRGWRFSSDQIQFRNTVLMDLSAPEAEMLARMKQKTRYNVRLAGKKGVVIRTGNIEDLPVLYRLYAETSVRDGFVIRDENYYQTVWQTFMRSSHPHAEPLIAEVEGQPVAALILFWFAGRAYYLYGMSREAHREKMPTYLLQWEAIRRAKAAGCTHYDLWGAPDSFNESDGLWGVFRFKEGLGGQVVRTLGAWDYTPKPFMYKLYSELIPRALDFMRQSGKARTRQTVG